MQTENTMEKVVCGLGLTAMLIGALTIGGWWMDKQDENYKAFQEQLAYCKNTFSKDAKCMKVLELDKRGMRYTKLD